MRAIIWFVIGFAIIILVAAIIALAAFCIGRESGDSRGKALKAAGKAFFVVLGIGATLLIAAATFRSWEHPTSPAATSGESIGTR
ncbi:hypothetical protein [Nonomuraea sp. NPDC005692]|uniref:hypothetical protein n=1 Tax=Nonomuraea sp. NPDC005692 TaxID=3157168 RepID=UPI0033E625DD